MDSKSKDDLDDQLIFADEDVSDGASDPIDKNGFWKILIVDDEADVHEITRITLRGYIFEDKGVRILSAYTENQVKYVMQKEPDIALILLDVVMEKEDTGLCIVEYIRKELKNTAVRIVLRTGQPGKAPEQEVITKYDINDYKTKPELTAQKLFTSVTACLRAYSNLRTIEQNNKGLEAIIQSTLNVFKNQSFSEFGSNILIQLEHILYPDFSIDVDSACFIRMPNGRILLMAGTGKYEKKINCIFEEIMPKHIIDFFNKKEKNGCEGFFNNEYIGIFQTKEGFLSLLYISDCHRFSDIQRKMVRIYANTIAIGFDNISLTREIINTQKEVILTLGEVVETRSQETANHVTRVAEICYLLAKRYGMDEETCEMLRLATPMHDVGKIGIPESILNKPGKLTAGEFTVMQGHCHTGYAILKKSNRSIMKTAAIVALQHHEKWDGSGYPQGLCGNDIHIFGRIAAVADVFDALSHKRCYKSVWPTMKIVDLFKAESGRHFDPEFVDIFLLNIKEFEGINKLFPE
ncbi:MAG: DUF3369 domain-containing protein [Desulfobacula sp.]|nr:DUF3369 domain-containing protein [Desulfobacula sp.]